MGSRSFGSALRAAHHALLLPGLLFLTLVLTLVPTAAAAAPEVKSVSRPPQLTHYDRAARRQRNRAWGSGYDNSRAVHVFLWLSPRETVMTIGLPADTPPADGAAWFRDLIDGLGWQATELTSTQHSGGLYLRAVTSSKIREQSQRRLQAPVDLGIVSRHLQLRTGARVLLAVRTSGGAEFVGPPPITQGELQQEHYGFFRLTSTGRSNILRVRYGGSVRWEAAVWTGALIWLLLPLAALFAVRRQLRMRPGAAPEAARDRLQDYRRWQRGILLTLVLGGGTTLGILDPVRVGTLLVRIHPGVVVLAFMGPVAWLLVAGRLIGLPLEREAYPIRRDLPWYRAVVGELLGATALLVFPAFIALSDSLGRMAPFFLLPSWMTPRIGFLLIAGAVLLLIFAANYFSRRKWRRRKDGTSREPLATEEVASAIRQLSQRLECPIERVYMLPKRATLGQLTVQVRDGVAVVTRELTEHLAPHQVAALAASSALAQRVSRRDTVIDQILGTMVLMPVALLVGTLAVPLLGGGRPPGWMPPMLMISAMSASMLSIIVGRRAQNRSESADVTVSDNFEEPRLFLNTLRDLEELQIASSGLDPASSSRNPVLTRRRTRLQERLGLD